MTDIPIRDTVKAERFRNATPGEHIISRDGSVHELEKRKEDGSGWWLTDLGGLNDRAFADGNWELLDESGLGRLFASRELHFGDYTVYENGDVAEQVNGCTCGPGGLDGYGHEPHCGLEYAGRLPDNFELAAKNWKQVQELKRTLRQLVDLFNGGPDTSIRTTWHRKDAAYQGTAAECWEVPAADINPILQAAEEQIQENRSEAASDD